MRNNKIAGALTTAVLSVAATLAPARAQFSDSPALNPGSKKTLTGMVSDSYCKAQQLRKAQTWFSCTLKCVHEEGRDYVLVVGNEIYVLNGPRAELDKFAGGRATITGQLNDRSLTVDSVMIAKKAKTGDHSTS